MSNRTLPKVVVQLPSAGRPSHLRAVNQRRVVESVARAKRTSRIELARICGISRATVGRIVQDLLAQAVLMETADAEQTTSVGRPTTPLQLDTRYPRFGLLQVGPRTTRVSVVPVAIPELDAWQVEFSTPGDLDSWAAQLRSKWDGARGHQLQLVVVSLPGVVDEAAGRVLFSPNLRWAERIDFRRKIQSLLKHSKVIFLQEIRALALGQIARESATQDFLLVDSGSGLGACAVIDGRLYDGPLPLSGEIGHTAVLGNTRRCGCGSTGCLETLLSRAGMLVSSRGSGGASEWKQLVKSLHKEPFPDWMKRTLDAGAVAIGAALNVLGLRDVVLTGAFEELPKECIDYLTEKVLADAMWARFGTIQCRTAPRHRQAGMISMAIECMFSDGVSVRRRENLAVQT